jgi:hypothetical protein
MRRSRAQQVEQHRKARIRLVQLHDHDDLAKDRHVFHRGHVRTAARSSQHRLRTAGDALAVESDPDLGPHEKRPPSMRDQVSHFFLKK